MHLNVNGRTHRPQVDARTTLLDALCGFQRGYCTPGQIMSAVGLLAEGRALTDTTIPEQMSCNICRCGTYTNIVDAVRDAAD